MNKNLPPSFTSIENNNNNTNSTLLNNIDFTDESNAKIIEQTLRETELQQNILENTNDTIQPPVTLMNKNNNSQPKMLQQNINNRDNYDNISNQNDENISDEELNAFKEKFNFLLQPNDIKAYVTSPDIWKKFLVLSSIIVCFKLSFINNNLRGLVNKVYNNELFYSIIQSLIISLFYFFVLYFKFI